MTIDYIEKRIAALTREQQVLETRHNAMAQQNQKDNQEFQAQAIKNQTRYAQIQGALMELNQAKGTTNNEPPNLTDLLRGHAAAPGNPDRVSNSPGSDRSHSGTDLGY